MANSDTKVGRLVAGIIGGILGAVGATIAAWVFAIPHTIEERSTKAIIDIINDHAKVTSPPDRPAARNSLSGANWSASNECVGDGDTTILVGWYCQIDSGGGNLQNAGADNRTSFHCTWNNVNGSFSAHAKALCLSWR